MIATYLAVEAGMVALFADHEQAQRFLSLPVVAAFGGYRLVVAGAVGVGVVTMFRGWGSWKPQRDLHA